MNIPKPNFSDHSIFYSRCGIYDEPEERTDCYFFNNVQDMGCHIPTCNYYGKLGYCPCKNCNKYIRRKDTFKIIKEYVDGIIENKEIEK